MRPIPGILLSLGLALAAASAGAERLSLQGGRWLETDGPWRIEGRRVVFRTAEGVLRSLPVSEVDLGAAPRERAGAAPLSLEPWAVPGVIPEPAPLPQPPGPARPDRRPLPPGCVLTNPDPDSPPEVVCGGRTLERGPGEGIRLDERPDVELWLPDSSKVEPEPGSATCRVAAADE